MTTKKGYKDGNPRSSRVERDHQSVKKDKNRQSHETSKPMTLHFDDRR